MLWNNLVKNFFSRDKNPYHDSYTPSWRWAVYHSLTPLSKTNSGGGGDMLPRQCNYTRKTV